MNVGFFICDCPSYCRTMYNGGSEVSVGLFLFLYYNNAMRIIYLHRNNYIFFAIFALASLCHLVLPDVYSFKVDLETSDDA